MRRGLTARDFRVFYTESRLTQEYTPYKSHPWYASLGKLPSRVESVNLQYPLNTVIVAGSNQVFPDIMKQSLDILPELLDVVRSGGICMQGKR